MSGRLPSPEREQDTPERRDYSPDKRGKQESRDVSPDRKPGARDSPRKTTERNVSQKFDKPNARRIRSQENDKKDLSKPRPQPEKVDRTRFQRSQAFQKEEKKDFKRGSREASGLPFLREDDYTNVVLIVEGKKLYIHSSVLGYASPYFDNLFKDAGGYDRRNKMEHRIEEKSYNDFVELLSYLHPAVGKELNDDTALRLLPLAHEFQIDSLKEKCEKMVSQYLRKSMDVKASPRKARRDDSKNSDALLKCLLSADRGQSKLLLLHCIKAYSEPDVSLKELKASSEISDTVKAEIYEKRIDQTSNQLTKVTNDLEREKKENEVLKKKMAERGASKNRGDKQGKEDRRDKSNERGRERNFRGRFQNRGRRI